MTNDMKKFLTRACASYGVTANPLVLYKAARAEGWVEYFKTPQNSMTARYRITDAGREALRGMQ